MGGGWGLGKRNVPCIGSNQICNCLTLRDAQQNNNNNVVVNSYPSGCLWYAVDASPALCTAPKLLRQAYLVSPSYGDARWLMWKALSEFVNFHSKSGFRCFCAARNI